MLKVLQIILTPGFGGAETLADMIEDRLPDLGVRVVTSPLRDSSAPAGVTTHGPRRAARILRTTFRLRRLVKSEAPEVVLCHTQIPSVYYSLSRIFFRSLPPVICVMHSASDDYASALWRLVERVASSSKRTVVVLSEAKKQQYSRRFPWLDPPQVVPNGMMPLPMRDSRPASSPTIILCVMRFVAQKDPLALVDTLHCLVNERGHSVQLWLAGPIIDDNLFQEFEHRLTLLGLQSSLHVLGPRSDIPSLLRSCDLYFHSSEREAMSMAVLEAASAGTPMVLPDLPEIRSVVGAEGAEYYPPGDGNAGGLAVIQMLKGYEQRLGRAHALRDKINAEFSADKCMDRYASLIKQVASAGDPDCGVSRAATGSLRR